MRSPSRRSAAFLVAVAAMVLGGLVAPAPAPAATAQADRRICYGMGTYVEAVSASSVTLQPGSAGYPREYELDGIVQRSAGEPVVFDGLTSGEHRVTVRLFQGATVSATADVPVMVGDARVGGVDRFSTAAQIASASRGADCTPATAYIASGTSFPDALSAAAVAGNPRSMLLLSDRDRLSASAAEQLVAADVQRVRLIGGPDRLSDALCEQVRALGITECTRIAGANRYATSMAVAEEMGPPDRMRSTWRHVVVVTGENYPDAVTAGTWAATQGAPIILVPGSASRLPDDLYDLLAQGVTEQITIVGGAPSVSAGIEAELRAMHVRVQRFAGADRYATNAALNAHIATISPGSSPYAVVATGRNFPDALTGSMLAVASGSSLVLSEPTCMPASVRAVVERRSVGALVLLGGPQTLSESVRTTTC
ncbi:cell wall-binding repeat-containing protein [Agrococcus jejuensis]|uniref:Putative cell wall binding repeat 2 n=1 Tax=Agrococcus jejuensis TaxID=399736 RepID=A0A1G8FFB7_9MICO|nr:cell wall-binding repeat-containing protein [Agrococcus jejuensis]SDH80858.1 Putative cell wall binding repeat 2 [Agrococcus jejuensis]